MSANHREGKAMKLEVHSIVFDSKRATKNRVHSPEAGSSSKLEPGLHEGKDSGSKKHIEVVINND